MRLILFRLSFVLSIIVLDQWSKNLAITLLREYERSDFLSFLDFILIYNKGIAFSLFDFQSGMQTLPLIIITFIAIAFFVFLLVRNEWSKIEEIGILLIIGGAIGNFIDRVTQGSVTDFILVYYNDFYFPAFNLADSFITFGIIILLITELLKKKE
ncbi:MAG: signal peptidase II [Gammaproteobacteria bacterium]|nr:signal peptidase II [Gammaproteobacteria bacterium]OUT96370.1 MAG: signal peptidase II [Gammaproteobacteria bacterium TMED36]|tara:strand:- start:7329 stop:7796 length:468 start_codon:yes stop_codon:yes gene_type:complete